MCFNNSFASIKKNKYLHDKEINPRNLFKSTNKKYKFECDICQKVFQTSLSDITKGVWCSFCVNKTEKILSDKLKEKYNTLESQFRVEWCKNIKTNRYLPFDFVIEERKIIIELDGKQHFEQISNWLSPKETRINDLYKMNCANENGFSVIRILQEDVFYDTFVWFDEIKQAIQKIIDDKIIQNIFICKNNEYDIFNDF
jgi:very-short-patch-repair endonuclease